MRRSVLFVLGALAGAVIAAPEDWTLIAASALGSDWHMRRASVVVSGGSIDAQVRLTSPSGAAQHFRVVVPAEHCGAPRGDITLTPIEGNSGAPEHHVWSTDDGRVASTIAAALCRAAKVRR